MMGTNLRHLTLSLLYACCETCLRSLHARSPDDPMAQPPHGTEVFMGGIPRTATEEQLADFAKEVGEVHSVALLKDPNNGEQNRGCAATAWASL